MDENTAADSAYTVLGALASGERNPSVTSPSGKVPGIEMTVEQYLRGKWRSISEEFDARGIPQVEVQRIDGTRGRRRAKRVGGDQSAEQTIRAEEKRSVGAGRLDHEPQATDSRVSQLLERLEGVIREHLTHSRAKLGSPEELVAGLMRLVEEAPALSPDGQLPTAPRAYEHGALTKLGSDFFPDVTRPDVYVRRLIAFLNACIAETRQSLLTGNPEIPLPSTNAASNQTATRKPTEADL